MFMNMLSICLLYKKFKVKDFPFDRQCCEINLYSWAHTTNQIVLRQAGNKNVTNITHLTYLNYHIMTERIDINFYLI